MSDEMAQAHRDYYADKRRIDDLRAAIDAFLADPPSRARRGLEDLRVASEHLRKDSEHIVAVWD